jgi:Nif-specific regulatory protein
MVSTAASDPASPGTPDTRAVSNGSERQLPNRRVLELSTLYEISKILGSSLDLERSLTGILRILNSFMGMRKGTILLYDAQTKELSIRLALGMTPEEIARGKYQVGEGILGKVMQHGLPMVIPDIGQEPEFVDRTRSRGDLTQPVGFIAVPIKVSGETLGVLSVDRLFAEEVSFEEDVRVLTIVASLIGQAVNLQQHVMREREGLLEQTRSLQQALRTRYRLDNIVGQSKWMREIYEAVEQVSQTRATVLIRGESGTGKELIARAIHFNSPRAAGVFVRLNCAALPQSLLESELFGHERGAFTGAIAAKKGRFELADGGSRFLEAAITRGEFREDLYYRLNVVPILLPPLRERREDIPLLIEHFLAKYNRENNRKVRITGRVLQTMLNYDWPGNVRELENCVERMVIMTRRRLVLPEDLPLPVETASDEPEETRRRPAPARGRAPANGPAAPGFSNLRDLERQQVIQALAQANGVQARAAALLGITPRQLAYRLRKYGIVRGFRLANEAPPLAAQA